MTATLNLPLPRALHSLLSSESQRDSLGFGPLLGTDPGRVPGLALLDVPNVRCVTYHLLGRHPTGDERFDAKELRSIFKQAFGIKKFIAAYHDDSDSARIGLESYLRRSHWSVHRVAESKFGINDDPVDDLFHALIQQQESEKECRLVLCSHDGGFSEPLRRLLSLGNVHVWIVGFLEQISNKLVDLTSEFDHVQLVDLEYHARAVTLPTGIRTLTAEAIAANARFCQQHSPEQSASDQSRRLNIAL